MGRLLPSRRGSFFPPFSSMPPITVEGTYRSESSGAKAGASIEPVIVAQLVDFDAPLVLRLMRHVLCHHQGLLVVVQRDGRLKLGRQTDACRVSGKGERRSPGPLSRYDRITRALFGKRKKKAAFRYRDGGGLWMAAGWDGEKGRVTYDGGRVAAREENFVEVRAAPRFLRQRGRRDGARKSKGVVARLERQ